MSERMNCIHGANYATCQQCGDHLSRLFFGHFVSEANPSLSKEEIDRLFLEQKELDRRAGADR